MDKPDYYVQSRSRLGRKWAVMKKGQSRAIKLFPDMDAAVDYCQSMKKPTLMNQWLINIYASDNRLVRQFTKFKRVEE